MAAVRSTTWKWWEQRLTIKIRYYWTQKTRSANKGSCSQLSIAAKEQKKKQEIINYIYKRGHFREIFITFYFEFFKINDPINSWKREVFKNLKRNNIWNWFVNCNLMHKDGNKYDNPFSFILRWFWRKIFLTNLFFKKKMIFLKIFLNTSYEKFTNDKKLPVTKFRHWPLSSDSSYWKLKFDNNNHIMHKLTGIWSLESGDNSRMSPTSKNHIEKC
jgi:hypothetical protein